MEKVCVICCCDQYHPCKEGCEWSEQTIEDKPLCNRCDSPFLIRCYEERVGTNICPFEITGTKIKKILEEFAPF